MSACVATPAPPARPPRPERLALEQVPDRRRKAIESDAYGLFESARNGERLGGAEGRAPLQEEAGDLERVEGIAARDIVHFAKRRAGQRFAEARENEPVKG